MPAARVLLLSAPLLALGCGGDGARGPAPEVADSAGVPVVLNAPPEAAPVWRLAADPVVEIGSAEGPPEQLLFRVVGGTVLSDGTIVLANAGTQELRFYDREGRHLRSAAGSGDGPGELRSLSRLWRFGGDSLLAWAVNERRASVFDPRGAFARSFVPGQGSEVMGFLTPASVLDDGSLVLLERTRPPEVATGVSRHPVRVHVAGPLGDLGSVWGELPGTEFSDIVSGTTGSPVGVSSYFVVLGRGLHVHAAGDRIAVGNDDGYSIRLHDRDGRPLHMVRQRRDPSAAPPGAVERARDDVLASVENPIFRERIEQAHAQMPRHATLPAYRSLRLDAAGSLWVEEYPATAEEPAVWQVFDAGGRLSGRLEMPPGLSVLDVGETHVLGVVRDDFDVERVRLYAIERNGATATPPREARP